MFGFEFCVVFVLRGLGVVVLFFEIVCVFCVLRYWTYLFGCLGICLYVVR